jgi:hypothetical protein
LVLPLTKKRVSGGQEILKRSCLIHHPFATEEKSGEEEEDAGSGWLDE